MTTPVTVRGRDLRALADIVSADRPDLPYEEGLAPSLLTDLRSQIRCDVLSFIGQDSGQRVQWFGQDVPLNADDSEDDDTAFWEHYWNSLTCSYPDRTGDLRSITKISDFYSARQWHSTGMYQDCLPGIEHEMMVCLPAGSRWAAGPGRTVRMIFYRGPGRDFSERDRALLILLRPHLQQAYQDAERQRRPVPQLTSRHWELLRLLAAGHTNRQIARRLGISEGTVRTHLKNIYERLNVSSRTAAVTRAFPDRVA
jgi:DNA-binding CsgD family transcriptional regulator